MQMTESEIVSHFKRNGAKSSQIQIIADLNACTKEEITNILNRNGYDIKPDGIGKRKKGGSRAAGEKIVVPLSIWATVEEKKTYLRERIKTLEHQIEIAKEELKEHEEFSEFIGKHIEQSKK